jgi:hypothetical protein
MTDQQTVAVKIPPLTGTERVRRTRDRKRKGIIFLGVEILPTERDALIRMGLLNKADRNGKIAVRDALYSFFEMYLDVRNTARADLMGMSAFGGKADISRAFRSVQS